MGETYANLTIHGPLGTRAVSALADTAATFTKIPGSVVRELGIEARFDTPIELGDGRTITRQLALAEVEIDGVRRPVLVALSEDHEPPLVGYTTLEALGFKVDTVTRVLEPRTPIEY